LSLTWRKLTQFFIRPAGRRRVTGADFPRLFVLQIKELIKRRAARKTQCGEKGGNNNFLGVNACVVIALAKYVSVFSSLVALSLARHKRTKAAP